MANLPQRSETVIFQEMDDGAVLFCTEKELYFGLNSVGKTIWEFLEGGLTGFDQLMAKLVDRYPDVDRPVLEDDATAFLRELEENELVRAPDTETSEARAD